MPAQLLLPLFALTLLANAFLVAAAIRSMRSGRPEPDRPLGAVRTAVSLPTSPTASPPIRPDTSPGVASAVGSGPAPGPGPAPEPPAEPPPEPPPEPTPASGPKPPPELEPTPAPRRRRAAKSRPAGAGTTAPNSASNGALRDGGGAPSAEPRHRGRRRFSLPPLDDDHEKVSRSIESFLAGVEAPVDDPEPEPAPVASSGATTVALVAVDGLPDVGPARPASNRRAQARSARRADEGAGALAMVERTLRGAARGTDVVTVTERGRFRIVLPATGELAARAYLRRIRATVEPLLEAADAPLRLVVATATVLDEPLEDAIRRAERRVAAALDAARPSDPAATGAGAGTGTGDEVAEVTRTNRAAPD